MAEIESNLITVRNAAKYYGIGTRHAALDGLNMNVPRKTIYGLLGPSGCGKTTLLQCILGRMKLDSGQISMNSKTSIGFMPQDVALYGDLSIDENLTYFGTLSGLDTKALQNKINEVSSFLQFPNGQLIISQLSGGQQRRVSLAVSLLRDCDLLILDEPTVGVDIVLSDSIWNYLVMLSAKMEKTIIITTHYIEEATKSNKVGLMREGKILVEESPTKLMSTYNCDTLEGTFLKILHDHRRDRTPPPDQYADQKLNNNSYSKEPVITTTRGNLIFKLAKAVIPKKDDFKCSSMNVEAMVFKNIFWIRRNIIQTIVTNILLPICICYLFGVVFGHKIPNLELAIVDEEFGNSLCPFQEQPKCDFTRLSCKYMKKLADKRYILKSYYSVDEALKSNCWAVVYFRKNFSQSLQQRLNFHTTVDSYILDNSEISVWPDNSDQQIWYQISSDLHNSFFEMVDEMHSQCGNKSFKSLTPFRFNEPIYGKEVDTLNKYTSASFSAIVIVYSCMVFSLAATLYEILGGRLERTFIVGGTIFEVFVSQVLIHTIILCFQIIIVYSMIYGVFGNPMLGNYAVSTIYLTLFGIFGIIMGLLIAVICRNELAAMVLSTGLLFGILLTCGMLWPFEGMHWLLRKWSYAMPLTYGIQGYRDVALRGWNITREPVYGGILSLVMWNMYLVFVCILIVRIKNCFS